MNKLKRMLLKWLLTDSSKGTCGNCLYNDGNVYCLMPPRYKCTKDGGFKGSHDSCEKWKA